LYVVNAPFIVSDAVQYGLQIGGRYRMESLLLTPAEAAQVLRIGRSKLYALIAAGEIPRLRVGKVVRVPAAALEQWVKERSELRAARVGSSEPAA
jgi:excisionase family DNA binding protein